MMIYSSVVGKEVTFRIGKILVQTSHKCPGHISLPFDSGPKLAMGNPSILNIYIWKIKDYTMRSKLYLVERNRGCVECVGSGCQVCKSINITDELTSFTTEKRIKLIETINVWFTCWAVSHAVNNM